MDKLNRNEQIYLGGGLVLLISSFLPWFSKDVGLVTLSENGWGNIFSLLGVIIGVAAGVLLALHKLANVKLPDLGTLSWQQVYFFAAIAATALVVLQLLVGQDVLGVDLDRSFGIFVGLVGGAGMAYAGFMIFNESRAGGGAVGLPPPPPPPSV